MPDPKPVAAETDYTEALTMYARYDWVVFGEWNRLHNPVEFTVDVDEWRFRDVTTACGLTRAEAFIPGIFTRMGADRCAHCCDRSGYPRGTGSPKNDICAVRFSDWRPTMPEREWAGLRRLAEAATPGPWEHITVDDGSGNSPAHAVVTVADERWDNLVIEHDQATVEDQDYIAAANPATILALLDELDEARAALVRVRALAEEVAGVHHALRLHVAEIPRLSLRAALTGGGDVRG